MKTTRIDHSQFLKIFSDALTVSDPDAFASDWALSSIFAPDPENPPTDDETAAIFAECRHIWGLAHTTIPALKQQYGLTTAQLAERTCIPVRTVENWCSGDRTPPQYLLLLIAAALENEEV